MGGSDCAGFVRRSSRLGEIEVEERLDSLDAKERPGAAESGRARLPRELSTFWAWSMVVFALTFVVGWLKYRAGEGPFNWDPLSDRLLRFVGSDGAVAKEERVLRLKRHERIVHTYHAICLSGRSGAARWGSGSTNIWPHPIAPGRVRRPPPRSSAARCSSTIAR